ncbi:MAG: alanine dehydrogenase [Saprospiraceae bacterium]|nr:alanine dehydrogenase [Saprospiraceae bacterium]
MKIGIIREGKNPPDSRVPLTPEQCAFIRQQGIDLVVQPSPNRCYSDAEYIDAGVPLQDDMDDCDVLMGVKEVPVDLLLAGKTYFFFSHTIKEQAYNRKLLREILEKNIRLIDYEVLTDDKGVRVIAFGKFAGMVGAHNALWTYGKRTGAFSLPRMKDLHDYAAAREVYKAMQWPAIKIVLTGTGRVGKGSALVLDDMGIKKVSPEEFLTKEFSEAVYTQLKCNDYVARKDDKPFVHNDFYAHPKEFKSTFAPYFQQADIMINGIYWDNDAPAFFTVEEMQSKDFKIEVIADVTCDIAPVSSIPSTLKASTIADPVFGFDPTTGEETQPYQDEMVDMMTIDNLPNELSRDASEAFGKQFLSFVFEELRSPESSKLLERATITRDGHLTERYAYLQGFVDAETAGA